MKRLHLRRGVAVLALGALAGTGLVNAPSPARAVISGAEVETETYFFDAECADTASAPNPEPAPLSDNSVPVTRAHSVAGTSTHGGNPADITDFAASSQLTAVVSPIGSGPATITATGSASARAVPRLATT